MGSRRSDSCLSALHRQRVRYHREPGPYKGLAPHLHRTHEGRTPDGGTQRRVRGEAHRRRCAEREVYKRQLVDDGKCYETTSAIRRTFALYTAWSTRSYAYLLMYWTSPRYGTSGVNGPIGEQGQGFFGVRFSAADGNHYGRGFAQGQGVVDWVFESRPNQPIRAGAKPVPVFLAHTSIQRAGYLRVAAETETGKADQVQVKAGLSTSRGPIRYSCRPIQTPDVRPLADDKGAFLFY